MNLADYTTITQAAKALGYASPSTLQAMARDGRISEAVKIAKTWFIPLAWLRAELNNPSITSMGGRGNKRLTD